MRRSLLTGAPAHPNIKRTSKKLNNEILALPTVGVLESLCASAEALLNDQAAATFLGVSPATLRSWRCRGIGPDYVKMGAGKKSPVRYSASDIEAFIAQCRQVPPVRAAVEN